MRRILAWDLQYLRGNKLEFFADFQIQIRQQIAQLDVKRIRNRHHKNNHLSSVGGRIAGVNQGGFFLGPIVNILKQAGQLLKPNLTVCVNFARLDRLRAGQAKAIFVLRGDDHLTIRFCGG